MSERTFPWRTLLFISVAFNLLIVGAVAGAFGAGVRIERQATGAPFPAPRALMAALPEDTRAKMRGELARTWAETRALRQQAGQARRDAFDAAAAEPFDAARVRAAFARVRTADDAALAAFHNNMISALAQMTPEERRRAITAMRGAAPIRRQAMAPAAPDGAVAPTENSGGPAYGTPRQRLRAAMRERRRERLGLTPP
jgi:uncharacterized membrane protein